MAGVARGRGRGLLSDHRQAPVRRAGTGRLPDGALVTWTVADGSKGRRWREAVTDGTSLRHALLFETSPDRRFSHLELATPAGLLTLHPEGDGTLHGNLVGPAGVQHVVGLSWNGDGVVDLAGSRVTAAAAAWLLDAALPGRSESLMTVLRITDGLELEVRPTRVTRVGERTWRLPDGTPLVAGASGLPVLDAGEDWALEQES